jgi:hypothetical protein
MLKRDRHNEDATPLAFSVETFAAVHAIGRSTAYNEIKSGRLKARKCKGRTLVTAEDAAAWRANLPLAGEAT